jgi:hypothetical protein
MALAYTEAVLTRIFRHAILAGYLAVTGAALVFTLTGLRADLGWPLVHWSYGMMAPYQSDSEWNEDYRAEGLSADGRWEEVSLDRYLPVGFGEQVTRRHLASFLAEGIARQREKYTEQARILLMHERAGGKNYQALRVWFDLWPKSPAGYDFHRREPFLKRELVTQVQ